MVLTSMLIKDARAAAGRDAGKVQVSAFPVMGESYANLIVA
jgi:hypothetical protein